MRLTVVAGLIFGLSMAIQSLVGAHARAKAGHAANAVRVHVKEVAPWYIADNDARSRENIAGRRPDITASGGEQLDFILTKKLLTGTKSRILSLKYWVQGSPLPKEA